jgi:hypothetical protein
MNDIDAAIDATPGTPLCPVCHSPLLPGRSALYWRCEYPEAHGFNADAIVVYPDWMVSDPPLDAATVRQLETVMVRREAS